MLKTQKLTLQLLYSTNIKKTKLKIVYHNAGTKNVKNTLQITNIYLVLQIQVSDANTFGLTSLNCKAPEIPQ